MSGFKVLVEGYAREGDNNNFFATCSTTVLWSKDKVVLVDPGAHSQSLLEAMKKAGLSADDIDIVYLSHYHPDHFLNIRLFPKAEIMDGEVRWLNDSEEIFLEEAVIPETDIQILATPGHSEEHTSLIIEDKVQGFVCIAQDVFWWKDGEQVTGTYKALLDQKDEFASDGDSLKTSRKKVLKLADYIIPGHGMPFLNKFKEKRLHNEMGKSASPTAH